jgi:hypothetical protein
MKNLTLCSIFWPPPAWLLAWSFSPNRFSTKKQEKKPKNLERIRQESSLGKMIQNLFLLRHRLKISKSFTMTQFVSEDRFLLRNQFSLVSKLGRALRGQICRQNRRYILNICHVSSSCLYF